MSKTITYYCALISPFTYLGQPRVMELADKGVEIIYKPIDILKVFGALGTLPPVKRHDSLKKYRAAELKRWSAHFGMELNMMPKHFPTPTDLAGAMVITARDQGADVGPLVMNMLKGVWTEEADLKDGPTLVAMADAASLDGAALLAVAETPEARAKFAASTDEAIEAGVFGSPTFIVDGEMFWGQDRIGLVEKSAMSD